MKFPHSPGLDYFSQRSSRLKIEIGNMPLTLEQVIAISIGGNPVSITQADDVLSKVQQSCDYIASAVKAGKSIYGVTSGFGGMADTKVSLDDATALQKNLMWFLKVAAGERLANQDVRAAMLLRMNSHLHGASGIRLDVIKRLERFLNEKITPHVYEFGSIGASGDLVPLSYITGALIGLDSQYSVDFDGEEMDALSALKRLDLLPLELLPKEGLAMVNGTSMMTGIAANCMGESWQLLTLIFSIQSLFFQAMQGSNQSFHPFIHRHKPHMGQQWVAEKMLALLSDSKLCRDKLSDEEAAYKENELIQDRYSLRCMAQYLGPIVDGFEQITRQLEIEINSATDNPLVDVTQQTIYHGGNFLGQYVGVGMDHLRYYIGLLAKHLDTQIALLVSPAFNRGLPASLVGNTNRTINMGLKGLQIAGNSIMPLLSFHGNSIADRYPTHAEQFNQNISSQGFTSATLARRSLNIFRPYLAINLIFAVQAVDLRTYQIMGHYDARQSLSPTSCLLYTTVKNLLNCSPSEQKPLIWNDDEQHLDVYIARIVDDMSSSGSIFQDVSGVQTK